MCAASFVLECYRSPGASLDDFLKTLAGALQYLYFTAGRGGNIMCCGDFNINIESQTPDSNKLLLFFAEFGMTPAVSEPTRIGNNSRTIIDNIFTDVAHQTTNV